MDLVRLYYMFVLGRLTQMKWSHFARLSTTSLHMSTLFSLRRWLFAAQCLTGVAIASCVMCVLQTNLHPKRSFCHVVNNEGRFEGLLLLLSSLMEEEFNEGQPTQFGERLGRGEQRCAKIYQENMLMSN